jgi:Pycsar effector protein
MMSSQTTSDAVDYSRRLLELVINWYNNADSKAQVILTLDGAFLTFLTSSILSSPDELAKIIGRFGPDTWLFLILMGISLVASIVSALMCLLSRIFLMPKQDSVLGREKARVKTAEKYSPNVMMFFQSVSWLDHDKFQEQLKTVDKEFEVEAIASQIYHLAKRVTTKHKAVNYGFAFAGGTLVFFLAVGISYVARFK